jgi:hypothetical protein
MAKTKLLGTPALLLALVVGFVACDDGSTTNGGGGPKETEIKGKTLVEALAQIKSEAGAKSPYRIVLGDDEAVIGSANLDADTLGKANVSVRLIAGKPDDGVTLTLASADGQAVGTDVTSMFVLDAAKLILDKGVTLQGYEDTDAGSDTGHPLVQVGDTATFEMNEGSEITGAVNTTEAVAGGGVNVAENGTFNMNGGKIHANTGNDAGAGVYLGGENAKFTMKGGDIELNTFGGTGSNLTGAGVYVGAGATFDMQGGKINDNGNAKALAGGGVYVLGTGTADDTKATFTMSGGEIKGHTTGAAGTGGGVYVGDFATFTLSGTGVISGNSAVGTSFGGGVYVANGGTLNISGGRIAGNTANSGGGVAVMETNKATSVAITGGVIGSATDGSVGANIASFGSGVYLKGTTAAKATGTISDGEIYGNGNNYDDTIGGGVFIDAFATFTVSGGAISTNTSNKGGGVAVKGSDSSGGAATLAVSGGAIRSNTAFGTGSGKVGRGGGIYSYVGANNLGAVTITGGNIYASASGADYDTLIDLQNLAKVAGGASNFASGGHAISVKDSSGAHIDTTGNGKLNTDNTDNVANGTAVPNTGNWLAGNGS